MADDTDDTDEKPPEFPFQFPNIFRLIGGAALANTDKKVLDEVRRRLKGEHGEQGWLDHLRTRMPEFYKPLDLVDRLKAFRAEVDDSLFLILSDGGDLKWALEEWAQDRLRKAVAWATEETLARVNQDETNLPRHDVETWLRHRVCLCGRCWKT